MKNTTIVILVDNSGSMGYMKGLKDHEDKYLIDGVTRMSLIKKILLEQIIPTIEYTNHLIIRTFRHERKQIDGEWADVPTTPLIYKGEFCKQDVFNEIEKLIDPMPGGTPITAAIDQAVTDLKNFPSNDKKIILLTDGEENGNGNYIETIRNIGRFDDIDCKIFIVGLAQDESAEKKARAIATGGYLNIKSKIIESNEVQKVLEPLKIAVLKDTIDNLRKVKDAIPATATRSNSNSHRVEELLNTGLTSTTLTIDDEYSEELRFKSEKFVYELLCKKFNSENVVWLNKDGESGESHDFEILDEGHEILLVIECKGTSKEKPTFYLTPKEWKYFLGMRSKYQVYRVFNVDSTMNALCIDNLLDSILNGQVVPYLLTPEILHEERIFLTLLTGR
ncbi:protein NO VEIN domain-containing protein [Flavobacterium sp. 3HN19-14]|uniref:protein NO VEIN domain-containing protein n=1 Tax=Flavobacterium sp. 3HN19-14 TaxID=3448133 RepID=UPI003EE24814